MRAAAIPALAVALAAVAGHADAHAGTDARRVTIAFFGESVVEGQTLRDARRDGLSAQLAASLARRGLRRGGDGLLPATRSYWRFTQPTPPGRPAPRNGWTLLGFEFTFGGRGPSGYSAQATSPLATAKTRVSGGGQAILLYTTTPEPTPFVVTAGGRRWELDAHAPGPPRSARAVLDLGAGARLLTVHGPSAGTLVFEGAIDRRPVAAGAGQVEVSNLGHAGHTPYTDIKDAPYRAVAEQSYDVSIFLWSYLVEILTEPPGAKGDIGPLYEAALLKRARLARRNGGRCLVADPTPFAGPTRVASRQFAAIHRRVARRAGCVHTSVLTRLWSSPRLARRRGLLQADDLHPTERGVRLMAEALAPVVERLARRG